MGLNNMLEKAKGITGAASDAVSKLLDEFNAALPTMRALGFSVQDIQVVMGLLPEVRAKLVASAADVDVKSLDELIQKKSDEKTLVTVLKALQTAYNIRDQLGDLGLKGVEIDVTLGIPPHVGIGFIKNAAVSAPVSVMASAASA
jgi:predicted regulator of amino acid metabolism with ACT domain